MESIEPMLMYKFAAASDHEPIVFGAARPGYTTERVDRWIEFMQDRGIERLCCLLPETQLDRYSNLLETYRNSFGIDRVCWAPIEDFNLVSPELLMCQILPFLAVANHQNERVVVHCSGGIGRTGHILAAWLVAGRGLSIKSAISAVWQTGRNPYEAVIAAPFIGRNPWQVAAKFHALLDECHRFANKPI
jgi:protein-tyrosine phosphatase